MPNRKLSIQGLVAGCTVYVCVCFISKTAKVFLVFMARKANFDFSFRVRYGYVFKLCDGKLQEKKSTVVSVAVIVRPNIAV